MGYGTVNTGYPVKTGKPNGVASLDKGGKVPEDQLPEGLLTGTVLVYYNEGGED